MVESLKSEVPGQDLTAGVHQAVGIIISAQVLLFEEDVAAAKEAKGHQSGFKVGQGLQALGC